MTSLRRFTADDLFKFGNVNLDHLTETVLYSASSPVLVVSCACALLLLR